MQVNQYWIWWVLLRSVADMHVLLTHFIFGRLGCPVSRSVCFDKDVIWKQMFNMY